MISVALLASTGAQAIPIKISNAASEECGLCSAVERETFGLDAKGGFGHHPYPAYHRALSNRSDVSPMASTYLQDYQLSRSTPLVFGSWRELSGWLHQVYLRPSAFSIPRRDTPARPPTSVPEPSSIALMLLGIAATVAFKRRATLRSAGASAQRSKVSSTNTASEF